MGQDGLPQVLHILQILTWRYSVYLAEIFPTWMRAQGVSFSVAGLFTTNLIYTGCASDAFAAIGWKYYLGMDLSMVTYTLCELTRDSSLHFCTIDRRRGHLAIFPGN
jgi:hypothetical protein